MKEYPPLLFNGAWRGREDLVDRPLEPRIALLLLASLAEAVLAGPNAPAGAVEAAAYPGTPLGVARVHFEVPVTAALPGPPRFNLAGEHGRVLYPVFLPDPVPSGPAGPAGASRGFEVLFLFPGPEPVALTATTSLSTSPYQEFHATASPVSDPGGSLRKRELERWWRAFREVLRAAEAADDHYPVIESYLLWRLPRLLDTKAELPPRPADSGRPLRAFPEVERLGDLLLGTESIRLAMERDTLLGEGRKGGKEELVRVPPPLPIAPVELPPAAPGTPVEAIARSAPVECLYLRFPSFRDFQKTRRLAAVWGGSLLDLIAGRSLDAGVEETLSTQLALRETELSRLFGDLVIGEMALLAHDTFVREGSALGIVFEVRNEPLWNTAIERLRGETLAASRDWPGGPASEEPIEVRGHPVRYLHSPGNRVRSFHASLDRFHLISNCRRLVERFLDCAGGGTGSLADDQGFRHARVLQPLGEPESGFVFISDPFLRSLVGPAYRAEMTRRADSRAALELVEVALRVARAETGETFDLARLVARGYLPAEPLRGVEGSQVLLSAAGAVDSQRGSRGTFLPIPDAEVLGMTPREVEEYQAFSLLYQRHWGRLDPVSIRIRLEPAVSASAGGTATGPAEILEELRLSVDILPFARDPYQLLSAVLAPPGRLSLAPLGETVLSVEAEVGGPLSSPPSWMGLGLLDFERPLILDGPLTGRLLEDPSLLPAYLVLPIALRLPGGGLGTPFLTTGAPDPDGFYRIEGVLDRPLFGKERDGRLVVSTRKEVAAKVAEQFSLKEAVPAQARLRLDLGRARELLPALRAEAFRRSEAASRAGGELLSAVHSLLKVPLAECEGEAKRILAARVTCPAGGRYVATPYPLSGGLFFSSDAFPPANSRSDALRRAEEFRQPVLEGFRSLRVSFSLSGQSLHSEATLLLRDEPDSTVK
jgi:hypothetical protein